MKEHFLKYNDILNKINEVRYKIIEIKEKIYSIKGISYDDLPKGKGKNIDMIYYIADIEELEKELTTLVNIKNELKKTHEEEIENVKNERDRKILRMIYIHRFDIVKVSEILDVTTNHAQHLKARAVREFLKVNNINSH